MGISEEEDKLHNIYKEILIYTFVYWDSEWQEYTVQTNNSTTILWAQYLEKNQ